MFAQGSGLPSASRAAHGTPMIFEADFLIRRAEGRIGSVLRGKWRIDRLLGVGGMAAVYAGTHRNGKRGAIKILHVELSADPEVRRRFLQEGYVANKVDHPGAVSVLDDDIAEDGAVFLVMELLEGQTLEALAHTRPGERLGVVEALGLTDQLLEVLAAAHDQGIVHRDLKPENLFLTREGRLKVLDFGIARVRELQGADRITRTGSPMGTPAFLPPEQALGHWDQVGPRTDLWAAGATLFTLLTGRLVHQADTLNKLLLEAMTKPAPPILTLRPDLPQRVAALIDGALAFEVDKRWADARAMQGALREALGALKDDELAPPSSSAGGPASGRPRGVAASLIASSLSHDDAPRASRGSPARLAVAAVAGAAVAAVLIAVTLTRPDPLPSPPVASAAETPAPPSIGPAVAPVAPVAAAPVAAAPVAAEPVAAEPVAAAPVAVAPPEASAPPPSTSARAAPPPASPRGTAASPGKPPKPAPSADPFNQFK